MPVALAAFWHGVAKRNLPTTTVAPARDHGDRGLSTDATGSDLLAPERSCGYGGDEGRQSQASLGGRVRWEKPYFRLIVPTDAYSPLALREKDINLNIPNP